jgi:hypothetical protein
VVATERRTAGPSVARRDRSAALLVGETLGWFFGSTYLKCEPLGRDPTSKIPPALHQQIHNYNH